MGTRHVKLASVADTFNNLAFRFLNYRVLPSRQHQLSISTVTHSTAKSCPPKSYPLPQPPPKPSPLPRLLRIHVVRQRVTDAIFIEQRGVEQGCELGVITVVATTWQQLAKDVAITLLHLEPPDSS